MTTIRKTSGRYRLVLVNARTKKEIAIECNPLSGDILFFKNQKPVGLDLPVLDLYILDNFPDEKSLCFYLKKMGYMVTEEDVPKFAYQHNGATNYLDLIYQNSELYDFAFLFNEYKRHFQDYAFEKGISKKALRKIISEEIVKEPLWKRFYDNLIKQIHNPQFFSYITLKNVLGKRATDFIVDYLDNENGFSKAQKEAFHSAKYYLSDTFTAYKPIRGMIVSNIYYFKQSYQALSSIDFTHCVAKKRLDSFTTINPWELLTEEQLYYLEDHPSFCAMPKNKQEDIILALLGFTDIPWYQRTLEPLTEVQIAHLESYSYFCNLSYIEKIKFVNCWCQGETTSYQKKKV